MEDLMQKHRSLRYRPYHVPWYQMVNWDVAIEWGCGLLLVSAIIAIGNVILFGSFLRQILETVK
jgi:hypothetical protein